MRYVLPTHWLSVTFSKVTNNYWKQKILIGRILMVIGSVAKGSWKQPKGSWEVGEALMKIET